MRPPAPSLEQDNVCSRVNTCGDTMLKQGSSIGRCRYLVLLRRRTTAVQSIQRRGFPRRLYGGTMVGPTIIVRSSAIVLLLLSIATAYAQTQTATVHGVITDSSGAVVPNAPVALTNVDQNRSWRASTNSEGEYLFVQIPPGNYALAVEAKGFKKYQRTGLTLEVAQVAALDVSLQVGSVTEVVEVTAEVSLLETVSSTLDAVVNSRTAESLPLNGRNVLQLVALTPGINSTRSYRGATTGSGSISSMAFSANGGRDVSNEVMLDGSPQIVMGYNQPAYIPTPNALQEFRVQTNSLSAEYGRTGGAVVNVVHRSGTKEFHGVLYEFLRNDKFRSE